MNKEISNFGHKLIDGKFYGEIQINGLTQGNKPAKVYSWEEATVKWAKGEFGFCVLAPWISVLMTERTDGTFSASCGDLVCVGNNYDEASKKMGDLIEFNQIRKDLTSL